MAEHEAGVPLMDATLNMMMFADDIVLLSTSAQGLKKHLETLEDFAVNGIYRLMRLRQTFLCLVLTMHINFTVIDVH